MYASIMSAGRHRNIRKIAMQAEAGLAGSIFAGAIKATDDYVPWIIFVASF